MMTKDEILAHLEENKDQRGMLQWEKAGIENMSSVGIGVTKLKAFAKQIGKNHDLALALWELPVFECKILATLIDDPKTISREQIEKQIKDVNFWMLSYAYCNYLLPKYPQIRLLAENWMQSKNHLERRCGFQLLYQLAKNDKKLSNDFFLPFISRIEKELQHEENFVKDAMNNALWTMGMRNRELNTRCIQAAKKIGPVDVDYGDNSCKAMDVISHLRKEHVQKKFKRAD